MVMNRLKNYRLHPVNSRRLAWTVLVVVVLSIITLLLGIWPSGIILPVLFGWLVWAHGEGTVRLVQKHLILPSTVEVTEVPTPPSPVDHEQKRLEALEQYNQWFKEEEVEDVPPMEKSSATRLEEFPRKTKPLIDEDLQKTRNWLLGGVDQRTIATRLYGDSSKESMERVRSLISRLMERVQ